MSLEGIDLARIIAGLPHAPVVYFPRTGGMAKIGTSTRLLGRVNALSLSLSDVALVVPGGEDVETAFHERFARQRVQDRREWFWVRGPLLAFLDQHKPPERPARKTRIVPAARPRGEGVGLREACGSGLLTVSIESARVARKRDPGFPEPVGQDQCEFLYRPSELAAWERNRPRAGNLAAPKQAV
jgi:hypothetical protein